MTSPRPFNPWPVAIIAVNVLIVAGAVAFLLRAGTVHDDLVAPDYYDQELRYQDRIDGRARARDAGLVPAIVPGTTSRTIRIRFPAALPADARGAVELYRPSNARLDRRFGLALDADAGQTLDLAGMPSGLWRVRVAWTNAGLSYFAEDAVVVP